MKKLEIEVAKITENVNFMKSEVSEMKKDIKSLLAFKWRMVGFSICAAFLATFIVELLRAKG